MWLTHRPGGGVRRSVAAGAHLRGSPGHGEPGQPRAGLQGVRRPARCSTDVSPRRRRRRADRHRRPQRRRQDHPARGDDRAQEPRHRPGLAQPRPARSATSTRATTLDDTHTVREAVLGGRADHEWAADAAHARGRRGAARRRRARPRGRRALRRRAPALLAGRAAARRPRPGRPRRADQPPRRRGRGLAGRSTSRPLPSRAGRGHPRPVVPRRGLPATWEVHDGVGRRLRGRLRGVRAGQGRAAAAGGGLGGRAGRTWSARSSPGCGAAPPARTSKPKFRIDAANAADRGRAAAARPARAAAVRHPAARQGRHRRRGRRPGRAASGTLLDARHLAARPGRPGRASSASTAPARRSVLALLAGDARARRRAG